MGLFGGLFGSKSKNKNQVDPWDQALPYITGNETTPGFLPEAARMYGQGGMNDNMQNAVNVFSQGVIDRAVDPRLQGFNSASYDMLNGGKWLGQGGMDTNFGPVANVNMQQARASQGVLDPTQSLQKMLSGTPDNPYLQSQIDAMSSNMARNLNENVMPGLRSEALASGQYGGSRQGIAEGLAMSRMNQDLAPAITNLLGNTYESAQNRMFGTASQLNDQAYNTAFGNANLGLQNNAQQMDQNKQNLQNRLAGVDVANSGLDMLNNMNSMNDNNFAQYMNAQTMPQNINWNNLNQYGNMAISGAQLGNQSVGKNTQSPGIVPAILGTAAGIGGAGRMMGMFGG